MLLHMRNDTSGRLPKNIQLFLKIIGKKTVADITTVTNIDKSEIIDSKFRVIRALDFFLNLTFA